MILNFYTDGACAVTKQSGGWAFYCKELSLHVCGHMNNTTNNVMEIFAVLSVLKYIYESRISVDQVNIYSDSMYVIGTITRNWKINKNQQYWDIVFRYLSLIDVPITFTHVYGHTGLSENELVDSLAVIMSNI